ncbi:hypothetical protein MMPV_000031 [Pyropia vietnamensis]
MAFVPAPGAAAARVGASSSSRRAASVAASSSLRRRTTATAVASSSSSAFRGASLRPATTLAAAVTPTAAAAPRMVAASGSVPAETVAVTPRSLGDVVSGFVLEREEYVSEMASTVRVWKHRGTGTQLVSVLNGDENKTFGVVFRTPPTDSTGVPHILEHSVLCGSRKYPVKEPFVELMKGSLNTFLNAFTYPDKTCYPVASCNEQDFYNLVDVYMDAVFHPRLTPDTLAQEGHHLEADSTSGPISIKGVVYNEMKGAYSSPDRVLGEYSQRVLFPDTTYGVESGGHPRNIPDLTWEQFSGFHARYYHPSNARMWFYGDDPEERRLAKADEFLAEFKASPVDSHIDLQKRWDSPRSFTYDYDAGAGDLTNKYMATVNWLLSPIDSTDPEKLLELSVLNHILLSMSASPLRKALTDSQLGEDVVGGGLEVDLRQMSFSVGLKGLPSDGQAKMEAIVDDVLQKVAKEGFSKEMIDASLNTIEFRLRENNTGSFPKGLSFMLRAMTTWLHDADPLQALKFEAPLAALKGKLAAGEPVFQDLVKEYFLDNTHKASLLLTPDEQYSVKEEAAEQARIAAATKDFTDADRQGIVDSTMRLKAKQAAIDPPEALASIPMLTRKDLDRKAKSVPYEKEMMGSSGATVVNHPLFTNGVVYFDLLLSMDKLPAHLLPLMSIFSGSLAELGTTKRDFVSLQQEIGRETGGLRSSTFISQLVSADGNGPAMSRLVVRGKGMISQVPKMLDLTREILLDVDVTNKERLRQLLIEERSGLESGIAGSGHTVAATRLNAMSRPGAWADEQMGGISYLVAVRSLLKRIDSDWASVQADMRAILDAVVSQENMLVNVTTTADDYRTIRPSIESFVAALPSRPSVSDSPWTVNTPLLPAVNEGIIVPSTVNYVGLSANLADLGFHPSGAHSLAAKHLGTSYLWDKVRVQGGAYGGFCRLDARTGQFSYLSYRDPNVEGTLNAYKGAAEWLRSVDLTDEEMTKSVIGMIGALDSYQLPDAKGFGSAVRLLTNETDEFRQGRREQVLDATIKDFHELGEALEAINTKGNVVVVGGAEALKKANDDGVGLKLNNVVAEA